MRPALLYTLLLVAGSAAALHDPISAVQGLISRRLGPAFVPSFSLVVIPAANSSSTSTPLDVYELDTSAQSPVIIRGNTGVALAAGLGFYLKSLNCSWTWGRNGTGWQLAPLLARGPSALPPPTTPGRVVSPVRWRYYSNVCTPGYTSWAWSIDQWLEEIDRLALWGINAPLSFAGQEKVWLDVYTAAGVNASDVLDFLGGPAFLPWQRMGNLQRWAGPLDMDWVAGQQQLQVASLAAMRSFGMTPVLPGFAGHVPQALTTLYPASNFTRSSDWNGFNASFSDDYLLEPTDTLFRTLGTSFYETYLATYGSNDGVNLFNADTYNEMSPSSSDPAYLKATNAAIYGAMTSVDPSAIFVLQGWLFYNDPGFWGSLQVEAFLSGVPNASMLILDLYSDSHVVAFDHNSYFGKPWVWNMLQVFGGRRGLYGNLWDVANGPVVNLTAPGSSMAGIGTTPEAVEITPVTFELIFEMGWRSTPPDLAAWVAAYAVRRYGVDSPSLSAAWAILLECCYTRPASYGITLNLCPLEDAPGLAIDSGDRNTDPNGIPQALRLFLQAAVNGEVDASASATFRYDLVDLARQLLCNVFADAAALAGVEFQRFQFENVNTSLSVLPTQNFLTQLIADLDDLLATDVNFMLGPHLADAAATAKTPAEAASRDFNYRNQITLWGPNGEIADYAAKNGWSGLVGDYYGGRWGLHAAYLNASILAGQQPDWGAYQADLAKFQWEWNVDTTTSYPTQPSGKSSLVLAQGIAAKYAGAAGAGGRGSPAPPAGYSVVKDTDVQGAYVNLIHAWTTDLGVLATVCNVDPSCSGFITTGWIKNVTGPANRVASPGCDLYVKN
jgi:alpha-N-acetylglucosaminidase